MSSIRQCSLYAIIKYARRGSCSIGILICNVCMEYRRKSPGVGRPFNGELRACVKPKRVPLEDYLFAAVGMRGKIDGLGCQHTQNGLSLYADIIEDHPAGATGIDSGIVTIDAKRDLGRNGLVG